MEGKLDGAIKGGGMFVHAPFFVAAAHELKSPLALVRQLSLELASEELSAKDRKMIAEQISLTSERALRLTTDLTKQARLEDSLFTLEPLNAVALCEEVVHELQPLYRAKGKRLRFGSGRRTVLCLANKDLLRRILLSLTDNAVHYADNSDVVELSVQATEGGRYVRLGVRDYGPAVPRAAWKTLVNSLGRATHPLHDRPASSGLGMYIATQFAAAMQGEVGAVRHQDGATFYVEVHASHQLRLI